MSTDLERAVAVLTLGHRLIDPEVAARMVQDARAGAVSLVDELVKAVSSDALLRAVAAELRVGFVDLHAPDAEWRPDDTTTGLDLDTLRRYHVLPVRSTAGVRGVVMANPRAHPDIIEWIRHPSRLGPHAQVMMAPQSQIDAKLVYLESAALRVESGPGQVEEVAPAPLSVASNPVVEYVDNLLARAVTERASDIHLLYQADGSLLVRFRIDGQMRPQAVPLRRREREITGTILAKCGDNLDASDRTRPQDGTFSFIGPGGRRIDTRLGMLPQAYGPTIVIRLLDPQNINRRLEDMGFSTATLAQMRRVVRAPQGAVFFIGPTGSGKTTTLYSLLKELPAQEMSILTAEDPIEYRLPFIGQTQIRSDLGEKSLTFAKTLRSMLRLDPDVILVGEVRDPETAETSMHAALTGHMVLSTLHAKTAVATYARLEELSVAPYLSAESVSLAVNQRLVRSVHTCATLGPPSASEVEVMQRMKVPVLDEVVHATPGGCSGCNGTGFLGRRAVAEVLEPNPTLRELVATKAPHSQILEAATSEGYTSIVDDAFRHVQAGQVPVMELLRVAGAGEV